MTAKGVILFIATVGALKIEGFSLVCLKFALTKADLSSIINISNNLRVSCKSPLIREFNSIIMNGRD